MGLDIYAGTLTRYYSHNWKTVTQQWAEANGYAFRKFTPEGEQAGEDTILAWADTEGCPTDAVYGPEGKLDPQGIREHTEYDTLSLAKFAFSLFWRALNFAEEQKAPILLDY